MNNETSGADRPNNETINDDEIEQALFDALRDEFDNDEILDPTEINLSRENSESNDMINLADLDFQEIPGLGSNIARKLKKNGLGSLRSLATLPPKFIQERGGIGENSAHEIVLFAQQACHIDFKTADIIYEQRRTLGRIVTGSRALNELLGNGIESGAITEFFGEYRTGKTQIAHQACVNVQLPEDQGGLNGKALYIDSEGTFRPERIAQMAFSRGMEIQQTLGNVIFARAYNSEHQVALLHQARNLVDTQNIKLIVVDSIIGHFRSEYTGLGSLGPRQQALNVHVHQIQHLVDSYGIAAIITNQVQAKPDVFFGNPTRPTGGNILAHGSTYRLFLKKGKGNTRVARLLDAPGLPEGEVAFKITEGGIDDID